MQLLNIPVEIAGDANEDKEQRGTSWARATRELSRQTLMMTPLNEVSVGRTFFKCSYE
jgi:hypothetical protein